jgi:DNA polymerase I
LPKVPGYGADDFLAASSAREEKRDGTAVVESDTFQLSSERTTTLFSVRAGEMPRIAPAEVRGVDHQQVPDFIALRGDPSDKIPGARGVGPKGAADLLRRCGLDDILAAGRFPTKPRCSVFIIPSQ